MRSSPDENPKFVELMKRYKQVDERIRELEGEKKELSPQKDNLRTLLRDEVRAMGLTRGSTLQVEGTGRFGYTTKKIYSLPADRREEFVRLLIEEGSIPLLTVGKQDLAAWCEDRLSTDREVPEYIKIYEDREVPRITLFKDASNNE